MKKFISGALTGAVLTSTIAFAASYVAQDATFKVFVNGKEFTSDPPALVVEGRTYLPLRAIGDALGVPVNWNAELNQAEVGTNFNVDAAEVENYIVGEVWNNGFWFLRNYVDGSYTDYIDMYLETFADSHNEEFDVNKIINHIKETKTVIDDYNKVFTNNEKWQKFYEEYNRLYTLAVSGEYNEENFNTSYFVKVRDEFCESL